MRAHNHKLARTFFAALSDGNIPDELIVPDLSFWTTTSGQQSGNARYQGGIRLLKSVFSDGPVYSVDSLTAEDDRVAAEVQSRGTLVNGEPFHNVYVFMLRIRDGRIASVAEHCNPQPVREQLGPLLQAAMAKAVS